MDTKPGKLVVIADGAEPPAGYKEVKRAFTAR